MELQFINGGLYLLNEDGAALLTLDQIRQARIRVTELKGFNWSRYFHGYWHQREGVLTMTAWMDSSLIPHIVLPHHPVWDLRVYTEPPLEPGIYQVQIYGKLWGERSPAVILASRNFSRFPNTVLSAVMNHILTGIVLDPTEATWMQYLPDEKSWMRFTATWEHSREGWWWWADQLQDQPLSEDKAFRIISSRLPGSFG